MDRQTRPFWWPDAQGFAIGAIIIICAAALFIRMFHQSNVEDKMLDTMITIVFTTCLAAVFQYLFGSSRGSNSKDETIKSIVSAVDKPAEAAKPVADGGSTASRVLGLFAVMAVSAVMVALFAQPAMAQMAQGGRAAPTSVPSARAQLGCDPLNLKHGCRDVQDADSIKKLTDALSQPMKDFVAFVQGDVGSAIALAGSINGLPDGNGQACFRQLKSSGDIIKSLQDTVDGGGSVGVATAFEALRLLHMNAIKTCNNRACTQVFSEVSNVIAAAVPMKTVIPNMTQICSQIPSIAMEPVAADAAPAAVAK